MRTSRLPHNFSRFPLKRFRYRGMDSEGTVVSGKLVATDSDEAVTTLRQRGIVVRSLDQMDALPKASPGSGYPERIENLRITASPGRVQIAVRQQRSAVILLCFFSVALAIALYFEAGAFSYALLSFFIVASLLGAAQEEDWTISERGVSMTRRLLSWTSSQVHHGMPFELVARTTYLPRQGRTRYQFIVMRNGEETGLRLSFMTGAALERCAEILETSLGREIRRADH